MASSRKFGSTKYEPLFDVHPLTGAIIEVFWVDTMLESFGWSGAGWFWWQRRRGFAPVGPASGPFPTRYSAYRNALCPDRSGQQLFQK